MGSKLFMAKAAALLGVAAFSSPALANNSVASNENIKLAPSSAWNIEFAEDACRLSRLFGEGDDKVALVLGRYVPGDWTHMVVAGGPLAGSKRRQEALVQFGPVEGSHEYEPFLGSLGQYEPALIFSGVRFFPSPDDDEGKDPENEVDAQVFKEEFSRDREKAIEWVAIERNGSKRVILELGGFGDAMGAMRRCTDELVTHWGIDVEAHRSLTRAATPSNDIGRWVTPNDYPRNLLAKGYQGMVRFRLSVDEDGKATQCHIQDSTRPEGFDKVVCDTIMSRAAFEPALDKDGNPIRSFYRNTVRFELP